MRRVLALVAAAVALVGCGHHKRSVVIPVKIGHVETGIASWYGHPYDGRASASGEIYNMEAMVAAHKTMPFQTWVRVYNLHNDKWVDVRIIDRGPFVKHRIIDLSHAAAEAIDMVGRGTEKVRLVVIKPPAIQPPMSSPPAVVSPASPNRPNPAAPPQATFGIQVGVFRDRGNAERLRDRMAAEFGVARIVPQQGTPQAWRVIVGSETSEDAANALAVRVRDKSGEKNAFIVRLDSY